MSFHDKRTDSALCIVQVVRTVRVSPHVIRVTVGGDQLVTLPDLGFDQWFRLFLPNEGGETSFELPTKLGLLGYLQYKRIPEAVRPVLRNYTVREFRKAELELDIDFIVHGDADDERSGIANRWAQRAQPGETVALLDQGIGYGFPEDTTEHLIVGDETGMPGIVGILRDLPRDARGLAVIEIPHEDDAQAVNAPSGMEVRWIVRTPQTSPGAAALAVVRGVVPTAPETLMAYIVGERDLPTWARRHLVATGVPKSRILFVGFWRLGRAQY
jgi:NADPH-dependent ferric siderophore reductase